MKSFVVASLFALSFSAIAAPKVGDTASYVGTVQGNQMSIKVELTAFDSSRSSFTQVTTTTIFGQSNSETEELEGDDVISEEKVNELMSQCESADLGGKLQTITVPAGKFETCAFSQDGVTTIYFGKVPFGIVKMSNPDLTLELTTFKKVQ